MNVKIKREYFPTETLGSLKVFDKMLIVFECKTIELPDKYNQRKLFPLQKESVSQFTMFQIAVQF
jgi:hypothetical protein